MGQIIDPAMDTWADAQYDNALVPVNDGVTAIAYPETTQGTDWLYKTTRRLSIDNKTRRGFVDKSTDQILESIFVQITNASPLNSHRQPQDEDGKARHMDSVEWCESRNGKRTSTRNFDCRQCPAQNECSWKIELTLVMQDAGGEPQEYMLTLPTASSVRFRQTAQSLNKRTGKRVEDVLWVGTVTVEENKERRLVYPVANLAPANDDGTIIDLESQRAPQPFVRPSAPKQDPAAIPGVQRGVANLKPQAAAPISKEQFQDAVNALALKYEASDKKNLDAMPAETRATKSEEVKKKRVQKVQIGLAKTALKGDDELRHTFVREHFTEAFEGSLTELDRAQLGALADTLDRPEAIAYVNAWVDLMTGK